MPDPLANLIEVLTRTRQLLLLPGNDFIWSSWDDAESAVREIDQFIQLLNEGKLPPRIKLSILFAPTGSLQEVSASSGWGDEFIALSEQFDRAEKKAYGPTPVTPPDPSKPHPPPILDHTPPPKQSTLIIRWGLFGGLFLLISLVLQPAFLTCACHEGDIKMQFAFYLNLLFILRAAIAILRKEQGHAWLLYGIILLTSCIWIEPLLQFTKYFFNL